MRHDSTIDRDVRRDAGDALYHRGYIFPRYTGKLSRDEYKSRQRFYAFWGKNRYGTEAAIKFAVNTALTAGRIPELV